MLLEGNIILFKPIYFKNGTYKPKFFLVLKLDGDVNLLAALPSSKDYVPQFCDHASGCIELPECGFNCYRIEKGLEITTNRKCFTKDTFIYGHLLDDFCQSELLEKYPRKDIDYEVFGTLNDVVFEGIIKCLLNSKVVKKKYLRILGRS